MSATHHPGWRDWADGVSEAIEYALADIDQSQARHAKESLKCALECATEMAYATAFKGAHDRAYRLVTSIIWSIDAALTLQIILNDGPRDIAPDMDDRHAMTSAIPALLRHALALLDECANAMARHDKEHSR